MSKLIEVTSDHHWHKDTKLELLVNDDKLVSIKWYKKDVLVEFDDTVEGFIEEFQNIYMLFGTIHGIKIKNGTFDEVYKMIYNLEIPPELNIKFVDFGLCGCNMGHCGAILGYKFTDYQTIGDIIKEWGMETDTDKMTQPYYEYPDSVFLYMRVEEGKFKLYHETCYDKNPENVQLDDQYTYVSLCYSR
ncbi:hypothetical protein Klosneuvirus_1_322 [Klosneuvirus KNV1]|uniref:Uncharacterized protein n=1 Tax=Klosneuvirus KNV1 TaxID=1977640 RepID=A0A1V0SIB9_9VIRU|nr:hypothetical protein Klosneuvirus_1_322 [Klosneuvirus KNV1]